MSRRRHVIPDHVIDEVAARLTTGPAPGWQKHAECRGVDTELFYPDRGADLAAPVAVCQDCPVQFDCLTHAVTLPETLGIWGGYSIRRRQQIARAATARAQGDAA